jgi:secreted PhoX family phosphatase
MTRKTLLLATSALLAAPALADTVEFAPVNFPNTDELKRAVVASESVTIDGKTTEIGYHIMARSGQKIGDNTWGLLTDQQGKPVMSADGSEHISVDTDFSSLLPVGDKLYSVSHFESRPGAMYLSELKQDAATGQLSMISTRPIDFSSVGGLWVPCAGSVTPWGSHLGSEEYEPDAREIADAETLADVDDYFYPMARYFGVDPASMDLATFKSVFNPYAYGFPTEIKVSEDGSDSVAKHYAMGRLAVELAYVMPDSKTAYITDDGTNVGLYMFVADAAGDLNAGTLYAAKLTQTSGDGAGAFDLSWVSLGHATSDEIKAVIDGKPAFSDIFDTVAPGEDESCAAGFTSINTSAGHECLKVKDGMEVAASRLETRRYAAMMGATTEGVTFDPASSTLFVAMSEIGKGMEVGAKQDVGGPDDVQLAGNACGAVYRLSVGTDSGIGSDYVAKDMTGLVAGTPSDYAEGSEYAGNSCDIDGIANPDNLTYMTGTNTLIIGEDTGSGHQNDAIWAYDMDAGSLTRIMTTPYGSETTSPYYYPNINGWGYLMAVIQHPYGESDEDKLADPSDAMAYVGYVGPFPAK